MAVTSEQQDIIDRASQALSDDPAVEAAWLAGSLGQGAGDAFSDVDLLVLVGQGAATEAGLRYAAGVAAIAPPALVNTLLGGRVISVVTTDWRRFDLSFIEAPELARYDASALMPLFNKGDRTPPRREATPYRTTPEAVLPLVNEFLRVLGLLGVAAGRQEWLLCLSGLDIMRRLTIDLMLEENGVGPAERGGALRRNPFLTAEQRHELAALSPVVADLPGIITANQQLAAIFLPRARRLAQSIGMAWPAVFEDATRQHLKAQVGLVID